MRGLLIKDFLVLKKNTRLFLLAVLIYSFVPSVTTDFSYGFIMMIGAMLPLTAISLDERAKWNKYSLTLPCNKNTLVIERYVLGISILVLLSIVWVMLQFLKIIIFKTEFLSNEYLISIPAIILLALLMQSIMFPLIFKFGIEKARLFYIVFVVGMVSAFSSLTDDIMSKVNFDLSIIVLIVSIALFLAVYTLSILISCKIYNNKEF